ncbi:uncharacterized protein LOC120355651 [Nilaparvata lugens]|uniref:uncharacterized protein LOC120355651 n=1 Tax=Nilaparvata lugens TaxID=108931 RepID=UPI00193E4E42|nr:uncharacterized protein LOC120355651 [Nilaparvata lugens]
MAITHQLCDTIYDPSPETKLKEESRKPCRGSFDCDIDQWCHGNHCDLPCPRKNCTEIKPPDGECVVRDHLPVCKSPAELEFEQELRDSGGCLNNDDCEENEWCMYAVCEDACAQLNCAAQQDDFECKVENHQPKCYSTEIEAGDIPDELVGLGGSCTSSFQCQDHLNCLKSECQTRAEQSGVTNSTWTNHQLTSRKAKNSGSACTRMSYGSAWCGCIMPSVS